MSDKRVDFSLQSGDNFSGRLALLAKAAETMHLDWCLREATWEPHDWRAFE